MNRLWNLLVSLAFLPITAQAQIEVKELPSRPGVTVRFAYVKAETPIASAVLFPVSYTHLTLPTSDLV